MPPCSGTAIQRANEPARVVQRPTLGDVHRPVTADTNSIPWRARLIRRDERTNHLDKLNMEGERNETGHRRPPIIRWRDRATQHDREWQFLRRRSPCVQARVVPNATVKTPR